MAAVNIDNAVHTQIVQLSQLPAYRGTTITRIATLAIREKLARLQAGYPFEEGAPQPWSEVEAKQPVTLAGGRKFRLDVKAENVRSLEDLESVIEQKVSEYRAKLINFAAAKIAEIPLQGHHPVATP